MEARLLGGHEPQRGSHPFAVLAALSLQKPFPGWKQRVWPPSPVRGDSNTRGGGAMGGDQRPIRGDGVSEICGEILGSSSSSAKPFSQPPLRPQASWIRLNNPLDGSGLRVVAALLPELHRCGIAGRSSGRAVPARGERHGGSDEAGSSDPKRQRETLQPGSL